VKIKLRNRISAVGCSFAAAYVVIVAVVFAATINPSKVGLDWFPMFIFAMPWYALDRTLLFRGFDANTLLLYLLGATLQRISRVVGAWETELRNHISGIGLWFAVPYVIIVVVVFAVTATTTNPSKVGLDWIPFIMLSMPWYDLDTRLLFPGFIANTALLYLLGAILERISRSVGEWG